MTSIVKFQSLSGIGDESPHCYILQIDDFKFLLDCGWDERNSSKIIDNLRRHAKQIDAILISHPDPLHLGCLPYAVGKLGMNCPIYMTCPTSKMGQMAMYDLVQGKMAGEDFNLFNLDDVDAAFDQAIQLKHNQTENMRGDDYGLKILPVNAGHMIGGTAWKITKDEEENFIYCVDVNHKREHHLNGFEIDRIQKPHLLITDGFNTNYVQKRKKERDEDFYKTIHKTTKAGGNVLIACDTAGRVLELSMVLDSIFGSEKGGLENVNLVIVSNVSQSTFDNAKNMIEWMSDRVIQKFTQKREQPYDFKHAKLCQTLSEVNAIPEPKVILATPVDMENGFSRDLFVHMSNHPKNTIILTSRTAPGSLARKLIENPTISSITLEMKKRINLQGVELDEYERQRENTKRDEDKKNQEDIDSSDESDNEDSAIRQAAHDIMISHGTANKDGGFFKKARKAFPMFPFVESRMKWDDYGELISVDDYKQISQDNNDDLSLMSIANKNIQSMTLKNLNGLDSKNIKLIHDNIEEDIENIQYETPTKCIKTREPVSVRCGIEYIDYEGRIDGESQVQLLNSIQPKEIIIVRSQLNIDQYKTTLKEKISATHTVHSPRLNEIVDATKERHIYQLKLKDSLLSNLHFVKVGQKEIEVAYIRGRIDYLSGGLNLEPDEMFDEPLINNTKSEPNEVGNRKDIFFKEELADVDEPKSKARKLEDKVDYQNTIPTLELINDYRNEEHESVFIDEIKLTSLKKNLLDNHIQAEFVGGTLICNGKLAIKRSANGQVQLEGALSEDYFKIRKLLYDHYAII